MELLTIEVLNHFKIIKQIIIDINFFSILPLLCTVFLYLTLKPFFVCFRFLPVFHFPFLVVDAPGAELNVNVDTDSQPPVTCS